MRSPLLALALVSALACSADEPVELFEDELVIGRLDAEDAFEPYPRDPVDGHVLVEVELGFQGAWMAVLVAELPTAQVGRRVDFGCTIETEGWTSGNGDLLQDVLVEEDGVVHAPYLILGWWAEEATDALIRCEAKGVTRADITLVEARLIPEAKDEDSR